LTAAGGGEPAAGEELSVTIRPEVHVSVRKAGKDMIAESVGRVSGCGRPARNRGVCQACKGRQNRAIASGEIANK
jgi:hypothetical protein